MGRVFRRSSVGAAPLHKEQGHQVRTLQAPPDAYIADSESREIRAFFGPAWSSFTGGGDHYERLCGCR